jgi:uroporphyrinogen-III decarboxylase
MNGRERFHATAGFQPVDRTFLLQPWLWTATLSRWRQEGLPTNVPLSQYFQTDAEQEMILHAQGPYGPHLHPPLERKILSETATHVIVRDEEGNTVRLFKDDPLQSMPEWIEYPMKSREDWEKIIKPRLDARVSGRLPQGAAWKKTVGEARQRDYPLAVWCGSFYGWPRSFMGVERMSTMLYDNPGLIHDMCEHIADFVIELLRPVFDEIQFDLAFIWEDMAGKSGPLCSPKMYRQFMLPPLKRVTAFLHNRGLHHIIIDSDGNNDAIIPLWLEGGVTGLRPFEAAAGCDPVAIRKKYGKDLIIQGAIDKRALAKGKDAIDREVLCKVPWLCLQGGFFPQVDHLVPPDVSLENYTYYSQLLRKVTEDPQRYLNEAMTRGFWKD